MLIAKRLTSDTEISIQMILELEISFKISRRRLVSYVKLQFKSRVSLYKLYVKFVEHF